MSVLKCKMCGGSLKVNDDSGVAVCEYCGTRQTISKTNDDVISNLYNRANNLRLSRTIPKRKHIGDWSYASMALNMSMILKRERRVQPVTGLLLNL